MRTAATLLVLGALAAPAHADIVKLGGYKLGQKVKKAKTRKMTLLGCPGTLEVHLTRKKVSKLRFEVSVGCSISIDTVTSQMGGAAPITNAAGDQL